MRRSWVIPCYQEAEALDAGLTDLLALPGEEIVFVDDGSTDGTATRLVDASRRDPRVRVVTHAANRGVGAAMRTGFAAATGDVVVAYDADRTYPAADAERLVAAVEAGADVASASPFAPGGAAHASWPRRLLSRCAAGAYRLVLGRRAGGVRTFTAGFRAYRASRLAGVRFRSDGFPATAEILGLLLLDGARVVEVPSVLSTRSEGRSKMRTLRATIGHLRVLLRLAARRATGRTS
ncbi:MAG TPA: glycosyltransferase family 2 protein [Planctomycetota bacterium]|nr:glycosyltransferase family 2 protein [Planctomycetota bacterium]